MRLYILLSAVLLCLNMVNVNAMCRFAPTSFRLRGMPQKRSFSSKSRADILNFVALARLQANHGNWEGVRGQAKLFAYKHKSKAELEQNKECMSYVKNRLDVHADKIVTDASIFHFGIEAIELQLTLRRSGAIIINLNGDSKKTQK